MWSYWGRVLVKVLHKATLFVLQSFCGRSTSKGRGAASYWGPGGGGQSLIWGFRGQNPWGSPHPAGSRWRSPRERWAASWMNSSYCAQPWNDETKIDKCGYFKLIATMKRPMWCFKKCGRIAVVFSWNFCTKRPCSVYSRFAVASLRGRGGAVSYSGPGAMPPLGFQGAKLPRQQPRGSR